MCQLKKNWCLKHWSLERQRCHLNLHFGWDGWGRANHLRRLVRAEQIPSQHLQVWLWCFLGPFPSFIGARNRRLNSSSNKPDVFSQKCASYPNCWVLNVACLQSPLQTSSTHAHVLLKGRGRWTVSLHLWGEVVSGWKSSVSSHFLWWAIRFAVLLSSRLKRFLLFLQPHLFLLQRHISLKSYFPTAEHHSSLS